jgi:hypothetical protein
MNDTQERLYYTRTLYYCHFCLLTKRYVCVTGETVHRTCDGCAKHDKQCTSVRVYDPQLR